MLNIGKIKDKMHIKDPIIELRLILLNLLIKVLPITVPKLIPNCILDVFIL